MFAQRVDSDKVERNVHFSSRVDLSRSMRLSLVSFVSSRAGPAGIFVFLSTRVARDLQIPALERESEIAISLSPRRQFLSPASGCIGGIPS